MLAEGAQVVPCHSAVQDMAVLRTLSPVWKGEGMSGLVVGPTTWNRLKRFGWLKDGRLDWDAVARDLAPHSHEIISLQDAAKEKDREQEVR